jgi:hypothetical protein
MSLLQQAEAAAAGRVIAQARRLTGSFLEHVEPSTIAALVDQSIGSVVLKAARTSVDAPFADAAHRRVREQDGTDRLGADGARRYLQSSGRGVTAEA